MPDDPKDAEDCLLESLLAPKPIADRGFSLCVVRRIRARIWLRRLTLPLAALIGVFIAAKPAAELAVRANQAIADFSQQATEVVSIGDSWTALPVLGAALLVLSVLGPPLVDL